MTNKINIPRKIFRLFHTVRYLKPIQIYYRIKYRLIAPHDDGGEHMLSIREKDGNVAFLSKLNSFDPKTGFTFLNQNYKLSVCSDWQNVTDEKLWLYNLHYFDFLNSQDHELWLKDHIEIIQNWISCNETLTGAGWESYPVSLRIINWIKFFFRLANVPPGFYSSLVRQARLLFKRCEYHLLGNHLFANAKALIFAGLYFEGAEANKWFEKGMAIVNSEIREQVLADGGNFELSPMYHNIFLEDVLDIINILQLYDREVPSLLCEKATKMLCWMRHMTHPDESVSFFNDAAINIAPNFGELIQYAENTGITTDSKKISEVTHLKESGYIVISGKNIHAILDVADVGPDYLPGHAHADTLSFELSLYGKRILVNSGTSVYGVDEERLRQRGSAAHNTLIIDGENSSEVWDGFRVARRARVKDITIRGCGDGKLVSASHTGYSRLSGRPVHNRKWRYRDNEFIIEDQVFSKKQHEITIFYHIHPDWHVQVAGKQIEISFGQHKVIMTFPEKVDLSVENSSYHPEFGTNIPNKKIKSSWRGECPVKIETRITWS